MLTQWITHLCSFRFQSTGNCHLSPYLQLLSVKQGTSPLPTVASSGCFKLLPLVLISSGQVLELCHRTWKRRLGQEELEFLLRMAYTVLFLYTAELLRRWWDKLVVDFTWTNKPQIRRKGVYFCSFPRLTLDNNYVLLKKKLLFCEYFLGQFLTHRHRDVFLTNHLSTHWWVVINNQFFFCVC